MPNSLPPDPDDRPIAFAEFREAVKRAVTADIGASQIPYAVNDSATTYTHGAVTVHLGEQGGKVLVTHVAPATGLFGHRSQASLPYPMTRRGAADGATLVGNWLADPFLYK
jgi:hypothetical protein